MIACERSRFYRRAYALGVAQRALRTPLFRNDVLARAAAVWPGVWSARAATQSILVLGYRMGRAGFPVEPALLHPDDRPRFAAIEAALRAGRFEEQ